MRAPAEWQAGFRSRSRIRSGEQLDVVGLVKRIGGGMRPYPSVARVAADPWVRGNRTRITKVISACQQLGERVIHPLNTTWFPQFSTFLFEGTAVYASRHHELELECEVTTDALRPLRDALAPLSQPEPYLAVLAADGDQIGAAISNLKTIEENRRFSQALAAFATSAKAIVNTDHNGVLIYAAGDDVFAFVPVDKCLDCARKLHDQFGELLEGYTNDEGKSPTLSVGVAIGHFMEDLEDLLEYGQQAEKAAKQVKGKDALAVHLHKRGGSPIKIHSSWTEKPDEWITDYARLILAEAIPSKLPYDLRKLADLYQGWPAESDQERQTVSTAIRQDVLRVIRDKQPRSGRRYLTQIEERLKGQVKDAPSLDRFAEELLVARQIAAALRQAREETG